MEKTPDSMLEVEINENETDLSDWCGHDSSSWVAMVMGKGKERNGELLSPELAVLLQTQLTRGIQCWTAKLDKKNLLTYFHLQ